MDSLLPDGDMGWAEDDFSVEELLDFGGLIEPELGGFGVEENSTEANTSSSSATATTAALSDELTPPADIGFPVIPLQDDDDAAELEWVSQFVDDSFSEFPPCSDVGVSPRIPENRRDESSTEVPTLPETPVPVKALRSKRSRSAGRAWSTGTRLPFTESSSSSTNTTAASCFDTNHLLLEGNPPPPPPKKQKKRGRTPDWCLIGERCCVHCGTQKTPQWREGPMGPKTLCNACGVRFKSGRLLPEYRPAGSPTFVPLVHSNSHRKVLELHRENLQADLSSPPPPAVAQGSSIQPSR